MSPIAVDPPAPARARLLIFVIAAAAVVLIAALASAWQAQSVFSRSEFAPGDQVVVGAGHSSLAGARGTVRLPPPFAARGGGWEGHIRRSSNKGGSVKILYWVQLQEGGQGVEIAEELLERLGRSSN